MSGITGQKKKVHINEEELNEVINTAAMKEQMEASIEKLKEEFIKNLSLRSSSGTFFIILYFCSQSIFTYSFYAIT